MVLEGVLEEVRVKLEDKIKGTIFWINAKSVKRQIHATAPSDSICYSMISSTTMCFL